ncbi:hypothetical protein QAD02_002166 [Eretmocerus hayati]|uniref:Uncharacterized protein n=1 Tax=Eretmocerus hayati TaxID=131215 RepID=A0ACC2NII2_9HYME|nr:hypothetical protein QAD02_002166 [Eretmocerus hayati]
MSCHSLERPCGDEPNPESTESPLLEPVSPSNTIMSSRASSDRNRIPNASNLPKRYNLENYQKDDQEEMIKKAGKNVSRTTVWRKNKEKSTKSVPEKEGTGNSTSSRATTARKVDAVRIHRGNPPYPQISRPSTSRETDGEDVHPDSVDHTQSLQESVPGATNENDASPCLMEVDETISHGGTSDDDTSQNSPINPEKSSSESSTSSQSYQGSLQSGNGSDTDALSDITTDGNDFRQFEDQIFGDEMYHKVMFESSGITVGDVILMIKACSLRFAIPREGQLRMGEMMKVCAGPEFETLSLSEYFMDKYVPTNNDQLDYHYYRTSCSKAVVYSTNAQKKIPTETFRCPEESCQSPNLVSVKSQNYFTSVSMEYQIKRILSNEILLNDIIRNIESRKNPSQIDGSSFKDVHDGSLNKQMMIQHRDETTTILSGNANADGAPFNNNGVMHGWPSQMLLNDLSPKLRWRNIILTGMLMTVTKEPSIEVLNLYMKKTLLDQLKRLNGERITVTVNNKSYTFCFKILNFNLDTPARAMFQNRMLYSALYGCSWCYQIGIWISGSTRFPASHESPPRTHESHVRDVRHLEEMLEGNPRLRTLKKKKHVRGAKGVAQYVVADLKDPNCPVRLMPREWAEVESRLLLIKPTQDIHRLPREGQLTAGAKMKASEARAWILCYALPCSKGTLNEEAFSHYSLLTKTLYTYLKDEIKSGEVDEGEKDAMTFIRDYEKIYKKYPTFNIHSWKHAAESIRRSGPPALNSAFPFESNIYFLKLLVSGPKDMNKQISKKYLQLTYFRTGCTQHPDMSPEARMFCEDLFVHKLAKTAVRDDVSGVVYFQNKGDEDVQGLGHVTHMRKVIRWDESQTNLVRIELIERKTLFVDVGVAQYVCTLPNHIEVQ